MELNKIYEEAHADLFPFHLFADWWTRQAGEEMVSSTCIFRNGGVEWYSNPEEQTRISRNLLLRLLERDFEKVKDNTNSLLADMEKYVLKLEKLEPEKMSSSEMCKIYSEYCHKVLELNSWGTLVTLMEMGHVSVVTEEVYRYLMARAKENGEGDAVGEAVGVLCSPIKGTYLREKKIMELEAAIIAKKEGMESAKVKKMIQKIHDKYLWVSFGYIGPAMSKEDFVSEIKHYIENSQLEKELDETKNEDETTKKKQIELEKKFHFDRYGRRLFDLARTFMWQKEFRKQVLYHSFFALMPMRKEMAKRAGLSLKQFSYLLPDELGKVMDGGFDANTANMRMKLIVYMPVGKELIVGENAEEFVRKKLKEKKEKIKAKQLSGQPAFSAPAVKGIVRIILNAHDMKKLKAGDILVSPATSPVMVPAMKIAGAIVTDQGGLTCHAAIVSRELRKACVIGTKIATKTLKDGDMVEVDSMSGIIRKI
jgi:phosphohistidine swiveling domain-containing protein